MKIFVDLWCVINDLLNLIEKYQVDLTDEDLQIIENLEFPDDYQIKFNYSKTLFYKFINHLTQISSILTNRISVSIQQLHYPIRCQLLRNEDDKPENFPRFNYYLSF